MNRGDRRELFSMTPLWLVVKTAKPANLLRLSLTQRRLTQGGGFAQLSSRMKSFHRLVVSFFAALVVFILTGPGAIALKAADGTSLESRVAHLESLTQNNPAAAPASIPATTHGCSPVPRWC